MRVWFAEATEPLPAVDGAYRALRCGMLADALAGAGHHVRWWTSTFDHNAKRHRADRPQTVDIRPNVTVRMLDSRGYPSNVSWQRIRHHRALAREFAREARSCAMPPDIIFACLPIPELAEAAVAVGAERGIPVVVDVRDLWPDVYLRVVPRPLRAAARLALTPEFRRTARTLRGARAITAVSQTYLEWAWRAAGRGPRDEDGVFPLGFRPPASARVPGDRAAGRARFGLDESAIVATFAGTFGLSYDLDTVLDAARLLADRAPAVRIVLAGDGDRGPRLRARARDLQNVVFTGWLAPADLWTLLTVSDIGLATYDRDALQSLPNKPFEYMAAGLPILASLRGELATLVAARAIGSNCEPRRAADLAARLLELAADPARRSQMGARARQLFDERFDADVISRRLAASLERIAHTAREDSPRA